MRAIAAYLRKPSFPLSVSALLYQAGDSADVERICRRLKLSGEETARVVDILSTREFFAEPEAVAKSVRTRLAVKPHIMEHLEFCRARLKAEGQNIRLYARWRKEIQSLRRNPLPPPLIDGNDLIALGCKPGPFFKTVLREVEDLQYEGSLASRLEALRYVTERRQCGSTAVREELR
jgi:poly(A) polymerase